MKYTISLLHEALELLFITKRIDGFDIKIYSLIVGIRFFYRNCIKIILIVATGRTVFLELILLVTANFEYFTREGRYYPAEGGKRS